MVDQAGNGDTFYENWVEAEARYAEALANFTAQNDGAPEVVRKDTALVLATARSRADIARDKFFRKALR